MEPAQVIRRTVKQTIMIKCHYYLDKASVAQGQSACPGAGGEWWARTGKAKAFFIFSWLCLCSLLNYTRQLFTLSSGFFSLGNLRR